MDLNSTDEEIALLGEFRDFLDQHGPDPALAHDHDELLPEWARRWQARLFDHGWLVPSNPANLGGREATLDQTAVVLQELAARGTPRSVHFPGYGIAGPSLMQFGSPAQQALAPAAFRGDTVWCIGMSEPDAGSDLASLRTRAVVHHDRFVVTGQKIWTSYAPVADMCLCYVRTDPTEPRHRGISALIVPMGAAGVDVRPLVNMGGLTEFAEVYFDAVEVPRTALLGELHGGWTVTQGALTHERSTMWVEAVARLERTVGDLVVLVRQLGLDGDAVVRQQIARAFGRVSALRYLGMASMSGDPRRQLTLKLATSELFTELLGLGCTLRGSSVVAFDPATAQRDWGRDYQRALAGTIAGGTSDIQRDIIGTHALGLPRK